MFEVRLCLPLCDPCPSSDCWASTYGRHAFVFAFSEPLQVLAPVTFPALWWVSVANVSLGYAGIMLQVCVYVCECVCVHVLFTLLKGFCYL